MTELDEAPDYGDCENDTCERCGGAGYYHDCGEDACCCADPDTDDLVTCPDCTGTGIG